MTGDSAPGWWEMEQCCAGECGAQGGSIRLARAGGRGRASFKNLAFILRIMGKLLQGFKWRNDKMDLDSRKRTQGRDWT